MLYYRWLLCDKVCTPELQHSILGSGLVSYLGREDSHKIIDLGLEHIDGKININMKCYQNPMHRGAAIFNLVYLNHSFVLSFEV